jgi:DNA-binding MarR family transcriptional regulator
MSSSSSASPATPSSSSGPVDSALDRATAERVSLGLIRVMKLMQALRHNAPRQHPAVDTAAYPVLFTVAAEPRRVSTLAELVHSDISTVSRQVTTLAAHGLLEKASDPEDRRAQVVRLTPEGESLVAKIQHTRNEWFARLLADWDHDDAADFAAHLERFGATLLDVREQATGRTRVEAPGAARTAPDTRDAARTTPDVHHASHTTEN